MTLDRKNQQDMTGVGGWRKTERNWETGAKAYADTSRFDYLENDDRVYLHREQKKERWVEVQAGRE